MPDRYEDELRFRQQYQGACEDLANGVPLAQAYLNTGVETTTSSDIQRELDDRMARLRADGSLTSVQCGIRGKYCTNRSGS